MEQVRQVKSRTAITINPRLWRRARHQCTILTGERARKVSFSQLVEEALLAYLGPEPVQEAE